MFPKWVASATEASVPEEYILLTGLKLIRYGTLGS